jgi:hypothetical protein
MQHRTSLFERLFIKLRWAWLPLGAALVWALIPFVGAVLAAQPLQMIQSERWRGLLVAPAMIVYIVALAPSVERSWARVYSSLRPVVMLEDAGYAQLVSAATSLHLRSEILALAVGAVLGLLRVGYTVEGVPTWLDVYLLLSTALLFGLLAWVSYLTVARTQATATILRQPLCIDPTEISSFMAIGEQGLILALIFIGGTALSLLFSALEPGVFSQVGFWLIYVPIALVPVAVFFLAMRPTHRVLADAKDSQLKIVRQELQQASRQLLAQRSQMEDDGSNISQQILVLAALEGRLQAARTWPYNTPMLRTLFVSILAPGALLLARRLLGIV